MARERPSAAQSKLRKPWTDGCFPSVIPSPHGTWSRSGGAKEMSLPAMAVRSGAAACEDSRRGRESRLEAAAARIGRPTGVDTSVDAARTSACATRSNEIFVAVEETELV